VLRWEFRECCGGVMRVLRWSDESVAVESPGWFGRVSWMVLVAVESREWCVESRESSESSVAFESRKVAS